MPWKTMDIREQRVQFVVAASRREKPFSSLCLEFGISRPTGLLWLQRYRNGGIEGIAERSRRPHRSPRQTTLRLEEQVVKLRQRYPDWGARKLQVLLSQAGVELTCSTIHRILLRRDLVREQDRHSPALERFERNAPNELWQMDFKGPKLWSGPIGPLSVLDDHSRYVVVLQAVKSASTELVREQLESAFMVCGVPEGMLMDHGVPWWSARGGPLGGATQLSLWLMKQGIRLHWSRIRHPQTQGKVERFHGALQRALALRGVPLRDPQVWLDEYRWEHNHVRPHEALDMTTPATHWRPSPRRYDSSPPPWQYPEGSKVLKVDCQGKLELQGQKWKISKVLCGQRVQIVRVQQRLQVYYCTTLIREIDLGIQRSTIVERWIPNVVSQPKL
jgi:transposase InsO family protein